MNYIQQAFKGKNEWYHWVITILLIFLGWQVLGVLPLMAVAVMHSADMNEFAKASADSFMTLGINNNLFLLLMIVTFFGGLIFLFIGIKYVHKRTITSLITSRKKIDWKRFWFGFFTWGSIAVIMIFLGILISPEDYIWNFRPIQFFTLIVISFLFLPLQTSFEELLFRGYFMQGLGVSTLNKRFPLVFNYLLLTILVMVFLSKTQDYSFFNMVIVFIALTLLFFFLFELKPLSKILDSNLNTSLVSFFNSKLTPLILTSVVFGLLHGANPEVEKLGYISMVFYIGTGFFYGITTLMDEGTELALGLHAINNIVAAFFVTTNWTVFQTDALYIDTSEPSIGWEMFFPVLVLYPLMLFFFSKKYGWKNWKGKLIGKIEKPLNLKENYRILDEIGAE